MSLVEMTQAEIAFGAPPQPGEDSIDEDVEHFAADAAVVGEQISQWDRQAQHPLSDGDVRKHSVHQVGGGLGHAPACAAATNISSASERHRTIGAAEIAVDPSNPKPGISTKQ